MLISRLTKRSIRISETCKRRKYYREAENAPNVSLVLSDGSEYKEKGRIESMSGQVDPQTGSFMMRATFPNENGLIRSGYSATLKLPTYLEK